MPTPMPASAPTHLRSLATAALLALVVLLAAVPGASAAEGFLVSPLRIDAEVGAGKSASYDITVTNTMDAKTTFTLGVEDIAGSKGEPNATPILLGGVVDSPISGAGWIKVSDNSVVLDPGQSK